jgi:acetolactate synthase-1/2/3 large subunit
MSGDDILVPGSSGASSEIIMQAFRVKPGMRIFNMQGLGSMGFGIAAAIGGCLASGGKRTVCTDGDGGFAMNTQELETIRRLQLPIKFFVMNNKGYGSIRNTQRSYFQGHLVGSDASSGLTLPDISKVAGAYGIHTVQIQNHSHIREQVREVLQFKGPVVCEVMISPEQYTTPRITSVQRPDGTMVSKPLEDMWPFLSRDEFMSNMLISPVEE